MKVVAFNGSPRKDGNTYWNMGIGRDKGEVENDEGRNTDHDGPGRKHGLAAQES